MNTKHLETFIAVVQAGSFSQAAQERYATASTLIQQVNNLERELGVELLKRGSTGVSLTEGGEVYLRWAKELLSLTDRARKETRVAAGVGQGVIRLGTYRRIERVLLKEALVSFEASYPQVELEFVESDHRLFRQRLLEGRIDLYVHPWGSELDQPTLGFQTLGTTGLSCTVAYDHPLASQGHIKPQDLDGFDVIVGCGSSSRSLQGVRDVLLEAAPRARLHEVADEDEVWRYVIAGNYILLNMEYSSRYLGGGVSLSLQWPWPIEYGFVFRVPHSPSVGMFLDYVASLGPGAIL